ncbi:MarR family transcriptional regulator [Herbaspirillum sp. SJZ099]|uniref:MarR family transcriptional regulator n=1 Tax=Herbaspirillum sp. SJZ099 TaxID=2572916 RepID=UPI0011AAB3A7|nr:MarR family transcriptional regulator [Herbaspirillum sp. SJZ099]TWC64142.1 MarR family transcriptional repressor of emrRAB [Herbaspirillum sp. SJZ099]
MSDSFSPYESAIKSISKQFAGAPVREAVLTRLLMHLGANLGDHFDAELREHGLNYTTWTSLVVLYSQPESRMLPSELATYILSSRTHCSRIADDLAKKGFISRLTNEEDRREVHLQLTPKGTAFVEKYQPERRSQYRELWSTFSAAEMTQFEGLLRKLLLQLDG